MPHIQDLMTISLSIDLNGIIKDGENELQHHEGHEETFSCGLEDAESTADLIREIADAIEEGRLYGWMMQDQADSMVKAGDLREETQSELFDRVSGAYTEQSLSMEKIGTSIVAIDASDEAASQRDNANQALGDIAE